MLNITLMHLPHLRFTGYFSNTKRSSLIDYRQIEVLIFLEKTSAFLSDIHFIATALKLVRKSLYHSKVRLYHRKEIKMMRVKRRSELARRFFGRSHSF